MVNAVWRAPSDVQEKAAELIKNYHPHLVESKIAIGLIDSKVFVRGRFNWGKVSKFSKVVKLWQPKDLKYDFCILMCAEAWSEFLDDNQKEALLDLCLSRCQMEFEPVVVESNGKKSVVKDKWGRVEYTDQAKLDDDGNPVWKVAPLGIEIFVQSIKRFGLWCDDLLNLKQAIEKPAMEFTTG